jgi:DNA-binding NarL/FixJ family response regulator
VLEHRSDVVLMDIRMPWMDGLEATRRILAGPAGGGCRIIILTTFDLDQYVYAALTAGASGFLLKDVSPRTTRRRGADRALGQCPAGAVDHPPAGRAVRIGPSAPPVMHGDLSELTPRELEVLQLLARGPQQCRACRGAGAE